MDKEEKEDIKDIVSKLKRMDRANIEVMNSNANALLAAQELRATKKKNGDSEKAR